MGQGTGTIKNAEVHDASSRRPGGYSLTWALFFSVVLVMALVFVAVQIFGIIPGDGNLTFTQRMSPWRLISEAGENLPLFMIWMALMMGGIIVALKLSMRSLHRISERAANIGPANTGERLPLSGTPREIEPLVVSFNAALDRMEAGLRSQRDFSASAAHELRTPLATLRAHVETVLDGQDREAASEEFDRLARLISQLLHLAEAESGADIAKVGLDLVGLARSVTSDMASSFVTSGRSIAFECDVERLDRPALSGLVEIALRNLLDNALRHTGPGCEIIVSLGQDGKLRVCDDGPGVSELLRPRLFQRFSKADPHGSGAGLGLSIVSRIMELHGGTVRLEHSETGACFVLHFPGSETRP
jgi:signal transduction histidine kinase